MNINMGTNDALERHHWRRYFLVIIFCLWCFGNAVAQLEMIIIA